MICCAISAYFEFNSMPNELRPARSAATRVEPVPAMGSSTVSPCFVKNSMNSCAIVSGYLAGCTSAPFLRGGGLWMNHDFWNFSQVLESRLFSLFFGIFFTTMDTTEHKGDQFHQSSIANRKSLKVVVCALGDDTSPPARLGQRNWLPP